MRLIHASHLYHPSFGGNQILNQWLSEKMADLGEDVAVFTSLAVTDGHFIEPTAVLKTIPRKETINGVKVHRFKINYAISKWLLRDLTHLRGGYRINQLLFGKSLDFWQHGPVIFQMLWAIKKYRPDIMLATNNASFTTFVCYLAKKYFGFPFVVVPLTHVAMTWTYAPFLKTIYSAADLIIVSTEFERKHLIGQGVPPEKLCLIGNGINYQIFSGADGKRFRQKYGIDPNLPVVSYIGRKVEGKGVDVLIDAMHLVWQKEKNVQLLLAGSPSERYDAVIKKHFDLLSPEERKKIFDVDDFSDQEKKDVYAASDIFSFSSNVDSFGMANLEAWISKLPIIAARNTPQESLISEGQDGLLVDYGNKEQLAEAILKLLRDPDLRRRMGEFGQRKVLENYTVDIYARKVRDAYQKLLADLGRPQ